MKIIKNILLKFRKPAIIFFVMLLVAWQLVYFSGYGSQTESSANTSAAQAGNPAPPADPAADNKAPPSEVAPVTEGSLQTAAVSAAPPKLEPLANQDIRAQLSPRQFTTLATEIGARAIRITVAESGRFRRNQLLVAFDCSIQKAQLDRSRADMTAASKTLAANQQLEKFNSIGKIELDTSFSVLQKAEADVAIAEALLAKCEIHAPFDGRIVDLKVREQQYVQPGQVLMEIIDDSALELEFIVPSRWLAWLKPGLPFNVTIDETGRTYRATFTRIGARVDPASMSVKVAGQIDGQHRELMAGMSGVVNAHPPEQKKPANKERRQSSQAGHTYKNS